MNSGSARASRAVFGASPNTSFLFAAISQKFAIARAQSPAREARALLRLFV